MMYHQEKNQVSKPATCCLVEIVCSFETSLESHMTKFWEAAKS